MANTEKRPCLWLMVTKDKYELPIAVFNTPQELADFAGCSLVNVYSQVSSVESGRTKRSKFRRVYI